MTRSAVIETGAIEIDPNAIAMEWSGSSPTKRSTYRFLLHDRTAAPEEIGLRNDDPDHPILAAHSSM
jgi:hypothetical protein